VIRASSLSGAGLVLTPVRLPLRYLGRFVATYIGDTFDPDTGVADADRIAALWSAARKPVEAAEGVEFHDHGETAELIVPGLEPLPIIGKQRIAIFARLYEAAIRGTGPVKTSALLRDTGYSNFQAAFRDDWKGRILGQYVVKVGSGFYRLADRKI
jgi:hypothetical protein